VASWRVLGSAVALTLVAVVAAGAAPQRTAACAAPKPLPASLKRPPAGASATQLANFLLALPQRKPCDVNLFTSMFDARTSLVPGFYPEGKAMKPAAGPVATEAGVRLQLSEHFGGSALKASALALFDRPDLKAKLPDPTLRAALVSLRGTIAAPVIGNFLSRTYSVSPRFCTCLPNAMAIAAATDSGRVIFFNARYQYEHFGLFSGVVAHEILHQFPTSATPAEEVLLNTLTALVAMQVLNRQPKLATLGTELSRTMNGGRLMLINSRAPGSSRSAVVAPNGKGTVPGSAMSRSDLWQHAAYFHALGRPADPADTRPAPPVLAIVFRKVLASGAGLPSPLTFGLKTSQALSPMNDTWMTPVDRLRVSVLLGLVSMDEIVKYTGLPRAKAIATFRLAPILAAMK
jgi:hypothetical protein